MRLYSLTKDAKSDLQNIVRYTYKNWGAAQVEKYRNDLKDTFENIGQGDVVPKIFSEALNDIFVTKSARHYIFYLFDNNKRPLSLPYCMKKETFYRT